MTPVDPWIAGAYLAGTLLVGFLVSRSLNGFQDFYFVAGGRMSTPVLVCTLVSTYYGLDVLFGGSEVGYVDGVVGLGVLSLPDVAAVYGRPERAR